MAMIGAARMSTDAKNFVLQRFDITKQQTQKHRTP